MKTRKSQFHLTPAEQAEQLGHLARLLDAVNNGLTGAEAVKTYLHVPSGRRIRIRGTDPKLDNCRAILSAATEPVEGDDHGKATS